MYNGMLQFGPPADATMNASILGRWTNKYTGESIIVRDSFIDGDNMIVVTSDGQTIGMNEFGNNYVQESDEIYDLHGNIVGTDSAPKASPARKSNSGLDYSLLTAGLNQRDSAMETLSETYDVVDYVPEDVLPVGFTTPKSTINVEVSSKQNESINRVFSKLTSVPEVKIEIKWDEFPKNEIDMLVKYFDVSLDDIAEYIVTNYVTETNIQNSVKSKLEKLTH